MLENVAVEIICWHEKHIDVLHGMHFRSVAFCLTFRSFWLSLIVFVPMIYLNDVFLWKAMTGGALNTFPNVLLIFNICQCILMIFLIFGKVALYVTENGIAFLGTASVLFNRVDLAKLSTLSIWFGIMFSLNPFSTNCLTKTLDAFCIHQKLSKHVLFLMLDCKEYSFLVKEDVHNLHKDNFDGQLVFYKVLFANGCYGLHELKCPKI